MGRISDFLIRHSKTTFFDNLFNKAFNWRFKLANYIMQDELRIELGHMYYIATSDSYSLDKDKERIAKAIKHIMYK